MDKPFNKHAIGVKWDFRTKLNSDGLIYKLKAKLVMKGYVRSNVYVKKRKKGRVGRTIARETSVNILEATSVQ